MLIYANDMSMSTNNNNNNNKLLLGLLIGHRLWLSYRYMLSISSPLFSSVFSFFFLESSLSLSCLLFLPLQSTSSDYSDINPLLTLYMYVLSSRAAYSSRITLHFRLSTAATSSATAEKERVSCTRLSRLAIHCTTFLPRDAL